MISIQLHCEISERIQKNADRRSVHGELPLAAGLEKKKSGDFGDIQLVSSSVDVTENLEITDPDGFEMYIKRAVLPLCLKPQEQIAN